MKKIIALFVAVATLGVVSAVAQDVTPDHIVISKQTHTLTLYGSMVAFWLPILSLRARTPAISVLLAI